MKLLERRRAVLRQCEVLDEADLAGPGGRGEDEARPQCREEEPRQPRCRPAHVYPSEEDGPPP